MAQLGTKHLKPNNDGPVNIFRAQIIPRPPLLRAPKSGDPSLLKRSNIAWLFISVFKNASPPPVTTFRYACPPPSMRTLIVRVQLPGP